MSSSTPIISTWIDTIQDSIGQVLPGVNIAVLAGTVDGAQEVDTETRPGSPLASIFFDAYGDHPVTQGFDEETGQWLGISTVAGNGSFQFWAAPGYYVIQAWGPGIHHKLVYGIALNTSNIGQVFADAEVPAGAIDGINTVFTLEFSPNPGKSLLLVQASATGGGSGGGAVVLQPGIDYTLLANQITFTNPPAVGDTLLTWYRH